MRSTPLIGTLTLALALPVGASAQSHLQPNSPRRPDINAFLNHKVSNTHDLVTQVRKDPQVANRYERHFAMTRQQVIDYLATLHRENLANSARYTVYSVPPSGVMKMHYETLRKGTPIFADPKGHPTLIIKCGNPAPARPADAAREP